MDEAATSPPTVHVLKTIQPFFDDVLTGRKTFELRRTDRDFHVGDLLLLRDYDAIHETFSGRTVTRRVSYVMPLGFWVDGASDYVVMGLSEA